MTARAVTDSRARRARCCRWLRALTLALCTGPLGEVARAAETDAILSEASRTFEYQTKPDKQYLRAALEELGLLGLGLLHYFSQHEANSVDWDLDYDWESFEQKLDGSAYSFDTNHFDTNFITHPAAGTLYYWAARGNRLSVLESLGYAFASSTVWEFFGEFREQTSINDLLVTPLTGLILGETTTQLGAFFDRSCETTANQIAGVVLGPSKSLHDAIDGLKPARDARCDRHGLASGGSHRFGLWAGYAAVTELSGPRDHVVGELRAGLHAGVAHLDAQRKPGTGWLSFSDGNIATLETELAVGEDKLNDFRIAARSVPAGLHYRRLRGLAGRQSGSELVVGALLATEYSQHRYDRRNGKLDKLFVLNVPGVSLLWTLRSGSRTLDIELDASAAVAGADAFALAAYRVVHPAPELPSVTLDKGYSHAVGFTLAPRLRLRMETTELGLEARSDRLFAVRVLDRSGAASASVPIAETRRRARFWFSVGPAPGLVRTTFWSEVDQRVGTIGDTRAANVEIALGSQFGFVLD